MIRWIARILQVTTLGAVIALAWVALHFDTLHALAATQEERNEYRARLDAAMGDVEALRAEREALARGEFSAEKRLRERFLLARPHERIMILEASTAAPAARGAASPRASFAGERERSRESPPEAGRERIIAPAAATGAPPSPSPPAPARRPDDRAAPAPNDESAAARRARLYGLATPGR